MRIYWDTAREFWLYIYGADLFLKVQIRGALITMVASYRRWCAIPVCLNTSIYYYYSQRSSIHDVAIIDTPVIRQL